MRCTAQAVLYVVSRADAMSARLDGSFLRALSTRALDRSSRRLFCAFTTYETNPTLWPTCTPSTVSGRWRWGPSVGEGAAERRERVSTDIADRKRCRFRLSE